MRFIVALLAYFDIDGAKKQNMAFRQASDWVHSSLLTLGW